MARYENEVEPMLENGDYAYCWVESDEDGELTKLLSAEVDGKALPEEELPAFLAKYGKAMQEELYSMLTTWAEMADSDRYTRRAESGWCE